MEGVDNPSKIDRLLHVKTQAERLVINCYQSAFEAGAQASPLPYLKEYLSLKQAIERSLLDSLVIFLAKYFATCKQRLKSKDINELRELHKEICDTYREIIVIFPSIFDNEEWRIDDVKQKFIKTYPNCFNEEEVSLFVEYMAQLTGLEYDARSIMESSMNASSSNPN